MVQADCVLGKRQRFARIVEGCARLVDEIWKVAPEELLWVACLEDNVMRSLADVAEVDADEFKSSVIAAAHVLYHFTWRRVLRAANEYPWS